MDTSLAQQNPAAFREWAAPFLCANGLSSGFRLQLLPGGANNRVYHVEDGSRSFVLKAYFQHRADPRDRFRAERAFYGLLQEGRVHRTPEPVAWDTERRLGLITFVTGRKLSAAEVAEEHVRQALDFISETNRSRGLPAARAVPSASEACFSVAEHLECVARRVTRLRQIDRQSPIAQQAAVFVREELEPCWEKTRDRVLRGYEPHETAGAASPGKNIGGEFPLHRELPEGSRCLSPSDFGFHNALLQENAQLRFFDFEYAGWDDPAKLICDFFCQPQVPVGMQHWPRVAERLAALADPGFQERARLLLGAYQIKWCCIMLNDFVAVDRLRREFASTVPEDKQASQLEKARQALRKIACG